MVYMKRPRIFKHRALDLLLQERQGGPGVCQERGNKAVGELEHRPYEEWLRELRFFLDWRRTGLGETLLPSTTT